LVYSLPAPDTPPGFAQEPLMNSLFLCSRKGLCAAALLVYSLLAHAFVYPLHASAIDPQNGIRRADAGWNCIPLSFHCTFDFFGNVGLQSGLPVVHSKIHQRIVIKTKKIGR